jgi:CcmD family protein
MNGWGWVMWGYGIVLIVLAAYIWSLAMRTKSVRQRLDESP